jgi:pimeloyl-ACP methyl ester carboxylesterase
MSEMQKLDPLEEHFRIPHEDGLMLFLRYLGPASAASNSKIVLYIHGATFPSALSIAHRFDGHSWRDELTARGYHVWSLDFLGFGGSDRYHEMSERPESRPALGRAEVSSRQVETAVRFMVEYHKVQRISIIAHSWGTMAASLFALRNPHLVDRLVFFAPIAERSKQSPSQIYPAWRLVSLQEQRERFIEDVPGGEDSVLSKRHFAEWSPLYLDTDHESRTRSPESVKVPSGPVQEIAEAQAGHLAYDPALIKAPVAIIRGEWDHLVTDADARWLFGALKNSPIKRDVKISRATHLMHLELNRYSLYREAHLFLDGGDQSSGTTLKNYEVSRKQFVNSKSGDQTMTESKSDHGGENSQIPGYTYGTGEVAKSPITIEEWQALKKSAFFSDEDVFYLRLSKDVLADQVDDLLKAWRGIIFLNPHLRAYDENPQTGEVDKAYAAAVAKRFGQWVLDTAKAEYDQAWLDYQYEIGLRHHRTKKNQTDHGHTLGHIRARDLIAFSAAIVVPMKPYLAKKGHPVEIVNRMYDAWWKSMILQVTLWTQPYIREGDF